MTIIHQKTKAVESIGSYNSSDSIEKMPEVVFKKDFFRDDDLKLETIVELHSTNNNYSFLMYNFEQCS